MGIKTNEELKEAIQKSLGGDKDAIWDVAVYKLYNYYMSIHVKRDSETDMRNAMLFKELELGHPKVHKEIEDVIDLKLEMIEHDNAFIKHKEN